MKTRPPLFECLFAVASFFAGSLYSYWGLLGNGSLLGQSRELDTYLNAIVLTSSYISIPLLIGTATAFFIEPRKLPWIALSLSLAGIAIAMSMELGFLLLLFYPFSVVVAWTVGISCLSQTKSFLAIPVFVLATGIALSAVIAYAESSERQAETMARAMCAGTAAGSTLADVLARARHDESNRKRVRWVQIFESVKGGDGEVQVLYRGTNLLRVYRCDITVIGDAVSTKTYSVGEPN